MTLEDLPTMQCREGCSDCCGPVPFAPHEAAAVEGAYPFRRFEWVPFGSHLMAVGAMETLSCPFETATGKCGIYDHRPAICRMFGVVDAPRLTCPHGCGPKSKVPEHLVQPLLSPNPPTGEHQPREGE